MLLASGARDAWLLFRYPVATGIDGYYYVLQVEHLRKTGRPYFSTPTPLIVRGLGLLSRLVGNSTATVKVAVLLLHTSLCLGIFLIVRTTLDNCWLGVLGSALAAIPQSHLFLTTEFVNQLGATAFLLLAGWGIIHAAQTRSKNWAATATLLLVVAFFSHRSAVLLAPAVAICVALIFARTRPKWKKPAILVGVLLWATPALISVQRFVPVPEWLQHQFSLRPRPPFQAPLNAEELMLLIAALGVLFLIFRGREHRALRSFHLVFGSLALLSLMVTLNPFLNPDARLSGSIGRLRVLSYIQLAILLPGLLWSLSSVRREAAVYAGAIFLPLFVWAALSPLPYGVRPEFLGRREKLIQSLTTRSSEIAPNSIIVAPHGDQFVVTATIGIPSQQRPPASSQYHKTYWLLNGVGDPILNNTSIVLWRNGYAATILAQDELFKSRFEAMTRLEQLQLLRTNPHLAKVLIHRPSGSQ